MSEEATKLYDTDYFTVGGIAAGDYILLTEEGCSKVANRGEGSLEEIKQSYHKVVHISNVKQGEDKSKYCIISKTAVCFYIALNLRESSPVVVLGLDDIARKKSMGLPKPSNCYAGTAVRTGNQISTIVDSSYSEDGYTWRLSLELVGVIHREGGCELIDTLSTNEPEAECVTYNELQECIKAVKPKSRRHRRNTR